MQAEEVQAEEKQAEEKRAEERLREDNKHHGFTWLPEEAIARACPESGEGKDLSTS